MTDEPVDPTAERSRRDSFLCVVFVVNSGYALSSFLASLADRNWCKRITQDRLFFVPMCVSRKRRDRLVVVRTITGVGDSLDGGVLVFRLIGLSYTHWCC